MYSSLHKYRTLIITLALSYGLVESFNLAPEASLIYSAPAHLSSESYFGYSVGILPGNDWLVVGSPRANITRQSIFEPGVMFKCKLSNPSATCSEVIIDDRNNGFDFSLYTKGIRDGSWFGGSLDVFSDNQNEEVLVCAPRLSVQHKFQHISYTPGTCHLIDGNLDVTTVREINEMLKPDMPTITRAGRNKASEAQLGMSVYYSDTMGRFLLGAPGYHLWDGVIFESSSSGSIYKREPRSRIEFSYLGISVSNGLSSSYPSSMCGAPGHQLSGGKVYTFVSAVPSTIRSGQQIGENFGAAVYSVDVNNDGRKDLIVGAPTYVDHLERDVGCVYVFMNLEKNKYAQNFALDHPVRLLGSESSGARFGTSLISPGDLNADGYKDVLVGAPYEDNRHGAVYMFKGSPTGLVNKYSQRITSADMAVPISFKGFGITFSKPFDIDKNGYSDFAVGSFLSGHVVMVRTRPVVHVITGLSSDNDRITRLIDQVTIKTCIKYYGLDVPQVLGFTQVLTTDLKKKQKIAFFDNKPSKTFVSYVQKYEEQCEYRTMVIKHQTNQMPAPIVVSFKVSLTSPHLSLNEKTSYVNRRGVYQMNPLTTPVLDPSAEKGSSIKISVEDGCQDNPEQICISDLYIQSSFVNYQNGKKFVIGSSEIIKMSIAGGNRGQTAYLPNLIVSVPRPYDLYLPHDHECERNVNESLVSFTCSWSNPILKHTQLQEIEFDVDVSKLQHDSPGLEVTSLISSHSNEKNAQDNKDVVNLRLKSQASIELKWSMTQRTVYYPRKSEHVINTTYEYIFVEQKLLLLKKGPTPLGQTQLTINYPAYDQNCNKVATISSWTISRENLGFECHEVNRSDDTISCRKHNWEMCGELMYCSQLICNINSWPKDAVIAEIKYQYDFNLMYLGNIIAVANGTTYTIHSKIEVKNHAQDQQQEILQLDSTSYEFYFRPKALTNALTVPWYWIVLAILVGIICLLAQMALLYKFGFFKRQKHELTPLTAEMETNEVK